MIVPVHVVGYSNMINSINGNTQAQTVYFQTPQQPKPRKKLPMFSAADIPLLTVAAISTKPKTLSAFTKSFLRLPAVIAGLAIPASIAAGVTSKIVDNRNKKGKTTDPLLAMAGFGGVWYGLYKAGEAGINKLAKIMPESYKEQVKSGIKDISNAIDASKANKKFYEPLANKVKGVLKAHPQIWKPAMVAASIAAVAICFAPTIKRNKQIAKERAQREQIAQMIQEQRAVELAQLKEMENFFNKTV